MTKVRAYELRQQTAKELTKQLEEMRSELGQLRVAKVTSGSAPKLAKIKVVRKAIARCLSVHNEKLKMESRAASKGKKYTPFDLRPKKTRAIRRRLTVAQKTAMTPKEKSRKANFPARRFAVCA